jgi:hypothetical protein
MKYFRPEFMKSFSVNHHINATDMFRHNFLIAYRNFKRDKSSFFINLIGLSTGLACGLLILLWVTDELSVDKFHAKNGQLYQILTTHPNEEGIDTWDGGPVPLAPALAEEMHEIEYAINTSDIIPDVTLSSGDLHFTAAGQFADKNYFNIFSYELRQGKLNEILSDKSSIVISESMALKLFNTTNNVLGKTIAWQIEEYKKELSVTGVFKDVPASSSDQFDLIRQELSLC